MPDSLTEKLGTEPRYLLADAAIFANVPTPTLRNWVRGTSGTAGRSPQPAVIQLDGLMEEPLAISFFNVIEAGFLSAYRSMGVPMQRVRPAIEYARERERIARPLLDENFQVNGRDLFLEYSRETGAKGLLNVSRSGQAAWPEIVDSHFRSIQYDEQGPILKWLFGAERPIVGIDPRLSFGEPCIVGRGLRTDVLFGRFVAGESRDEIAEDFSITGEEVEEALRWETESLRRAA